MLPPPSAPESATPWQLALFLFLGAFASMACFLKATLIPFRALGDIKGELDSRPDGPCAPRKLRPSFYAAFAMGLALIACSAGQFLRRGIGLPAALAEVFLVAGIGWIMGTSFLWLRLHVRSGP
jgi:hypothetical protein